MDSKDPSGDFREFIEGEIRYSQLKIQSPERAALLFEQCEERDALQKTSQNKAAFGEGNFLKAGLKNKAPVRGIPGGRRFPHDLIYDFRRHIPWH